MIETIESFCDRHGACDDDKKWALKNCVTMNDVWECAKPNWLVWVATRPGVLDDKTLRMFIFWCIRWVLRFINNKCRNAGFVVEKFVIADATKADFAAARAAAEAEDVAKAAWAATCAATRAAARAAAREDLRTTSQADLRYAELDDTWAPVLASLLDLARDATRASARSAARAAARKDQAKWLRENAKPNFEVVLKKLEAT